MNDYVRACLRFWWVLLIGFGLSMAVAYAVAKHHSPTSYTASLEMMVDSPSKPFLRTDVTSVLKQPAKTALVKVPVRGQNGSVTYNTQVVTIPQSPTVANQAPDTQTLISAANLYPSLIESDAVAALRDKLFGAIPGSVSAEAQFATSTPTGKFVASSFPIIDISTESRGPHKAVNLALNTYVAFKRWLVTNQKASGVPPAQRITVQTLVTPKQAFQVTHTHKGLAALVGFALLAWMIFFVIVLDKVVPHRALVLDKVAPRRARKSAGETKEEEKEQMVGAPGPVET
jgi:hypothetical protein